MTSALDVASHLARVAPHGWQILGWHLGPALTSWLSGHYAVLLSSASVLLAAMALRASNRAQKANRELQRAIADRAGQLKEVVIFDPGDRDSYSIAFKAINGPGEVTIDEVRLLVTYKFRDKSRLLRGERYHLSFGHSEFGVLGIAGPDLPFRLDPHDVQQWYLPAKASRLVTDVRHEESGGYSSFEFQLSVTASGTTTTSPPFGLGAEVTGTIYSENRVLGSRLEDAEAIGLPPALRKWLERMTGLEFGLVSSDAEPADT